MADRAVALLLLLLAGLLFGFQYTTLEKFSALPPGLSYQTLPRFWAEVARQVDLGRADALLGLGILGLVALLLGLEISQKRLSRFLGHLFASERKTLLFLGACSLVLVRFYLARGELSWAGDAAQHISYAQITAQALSRGEIPIWTNYLGAGSPYLQFYGFLFFYLVGLAALVVGDLFLALKIALAGTHVFSGLGMYGLVRRLGRTRQAAFVAGLGYVLCFWHTQQVLVMGRLPLSLFYALLPWPFYFFEQLRLTRRWTPAAMGGLFLGLLAFTHPGYAFWATLLLGVYIAVRLWSCWQRGGFSFALRASGLLMAIGLLFGAFLTLPLWLERASTGLRQGYLLQNIPGPTWWHVLVWSNYRFWLLPPVGQFHWYGGYLGLSLVFLALFGLRSAWPRPRRFPAPALAAGAGLVLSLWLSFGHHLPPLSHLSLVQAMPAGRYLLFVVFFLCLSGGLGAEFFLALMRKKGRPLAVAFLPLLVLADLGPTTFQHLYASSAKDPMGYSPAFLAGMQRAAQPFARQGRLPDYRFFWVVGPLHPYLAIGHAQVLTGTPTPYGPHPGDLLSVFEFTNPLERLLFHLLGDLPDPEAFPRHPHFALIWGSVLMLNARFVLVTQADKEVKTLHWPSHTPVLVSPRISGFDPKDMDIFFEQEGTRTFLQRLFPGLDDLEQLKKIFAVRWIVEQTGVELHRPACQRILVRDFSGERDLGTHPEVEVLEHLVWNERVELRLRVSAACYARLAYSYFPHLQVSLDGRPVRPLRTAGHFMALPLEAGEHFIVLEPGLSPLRRGLLVLDLCLVAGTFWLWRRERAGKKLPCA